MSHKLTQCKQKSLEIHNHSKKIVEMCEWKSAGIEGSEIFLR